jgi:hypothetical protein
LNLFLLRQSEIAAGKLRRLQHEKRLTFMELIPSWKKSLFSWRKKKVPTNEETEDELSRRNLFSSSNRNSGMSESIIDEENNSGRTGSGDHGTGKEKDPGVELSKIDSTSSPMFAQPSPTVIRHTGSSSKESYQKLMKKDISNNE